MAIVGAGRWTRCYGYRANFYAKGLAKLLINNPTIITSILCFFVFVFMVCVLQGGLRVWYPFKIKRALSLSARLKMTLNWFPAVICSAAAAAPSHQRLLHRLFSVHSRFAHQKE